MVRTNSANRLLMNARVGECPSLDKYTLHYLIPVRSSIKGSMAEARAVIGPSGSCPSAIIWHMGGCNASVLKDSCTSLEIKVEKMGFDEGGEEGRKHNVVIRRENRMRYKRDENRVVRKELSPEKSEIDSGRDTLIYSISISAETLPGRTCYVLRGCAII